MSEENSTLTIRLQGLTLEGIRPFIFSRERVKAARISENAKTKIEQSHRAFQKLLDTGIPIYGVTTGLGDSCGRSISKHQSSQLQSNLISYLLCGSGPVLPKTVVRAISLFRLKSLARGFS